MKPQSRPYDARVINRCMLWTMIVAGASLVVLALCLIRIDPAKVIDWAWYLVCDVVRNLHG
jgi:hypothetical protein